MLRALLLTLFLFLFAVPTVQVDRVLVILVNFQDDQSQPLDQATAYATVAQTDQWYREVSGGRFGLSGDVMGWYTIPVGVTGCDKAAIKTEAINAAVAHGAVLSSYQHFAYVFPPNGCTFTGSASLGGSDIWIREWFELATLGHELGHNLGLFHSASLASQYGDVFDIMGGSNHAHFNIFQKEKLGWANVQIVDSGTYVLGSMEQGYGIKIVTATANYYLEYRDGSGFDSDVQGVLIHKGSDTSYLLDGTPETATLYDAYLGSYSDSNISVTANGNEVVVTKLTSPTPTPTPTPVPTPRYVCIKTNPSGKCVKWGWSY